MSISPRHLSIEQFRQENAQLQTTLTASLQENALLHEIISKTSSVSTTDELFHCLVEALMQASFCQAVFVYFYDSSKQQLTLSSTNEPYQRLIGKVAVKLGEGVAGWVASTRQTKLLNGEGMKDARFHMPPELEETFRSSITVPLLGRDQRLLGVISVASPRPFALTEQHELLVHVVALLAAESMESIQFHEHTRRKHNMLVALSALSQTASSDLSFDEMLRSSVTLTTQLLEADLCLIMLVDEQNHLRVRASSPFLHEHAFNARPRVINDMTWEHLSALHKHSLYSEIDADDLALLNPLRGTLYKTPIIVPIIAGTEHFGVLNCYSSATSSEDQLLLGIIANQIASAIKSNHLAASHTRRNLVKEFFDDLAKETRLAEGIEDSLGRRASVLGCDLKQPHAVVMMEISYEADSDESQRAATTHPQGRFDDYVQEERLKMYEQVIKEMKHCLQTSYPGSVVYDRENLLTCLVRLNGDVPAADVKTGLQSLCDQVQREYAIQLLVGVSNCCRDVRDYARGFIEAKEALQIGRDLNQEGNVTHFKDLGVYRYLYKIAQMDSAGDVYQEQIARIADYDEHKRSADLLGTLETYLECAGNLAKASESLGIHRNTLLQRLERIQAVAGIDLEQQSNRFALQLALKVYKLRKNACVER